MKLMEKFDDDVEISGETEIGKGIYINGIKYSYSINKLKTNEELLIIKLYNPKNNSNTMIEFTYEASMQKLIKDFEFLSSYNNLDEMINSLNEIFSKGNVKVEQKNGIYTLELIIIECEICKNYSVPLKMLEPNKPKSEIENKIDKLKNQLNDLMNKLEELKKEKEENITNKEVEILVKDIKKNLLDEIEKLIISKTSEKNKEMIQIFDNNSKKSKSIDESEYNYVTSNENFQKIKTIIKNDLIINILQNKKEILYYNKNKNEVISLDELNNIKNHIYKKIVNKNEINANDETKSKNEILIFFIKIINNLEIIIKYINILKEKGSIFPINIHIRAKMNFAKYFLDDKEFKFEDIKSFLINAKNKYSIQLDTIYKKSEFIRFLFGKQFQSMIMHLENNNNDDSILRYILNNTDNNKSVKKGDTIYPYVPNYINNFELFNQNNLEKISNYIRYISSLFIKNNITLEEHYNRMKIIPENEYKGLYLYQCKNSSMEEFIVKLYLNKLNQLPIAQNILISNEETSIDEIQSFLYRAILCKYNTLFAIEINNSFSDYQQNIMNSFIEDLLEFKKEEYIEETKKNIDKRSTYYYLNSCIVFIHDKNNTNNISFLKEIEKYDVQIFEDLNINNEIHDDKDNFFPKFEKKNIFPKFDNINIYPKFDNIKVITSDICGLGKSFKIKKLIINSTQKYFYFPLGGKLSKSIIFKKLENLLIKIKNNKYYKYIAIHLDLTESYEISILNEFFFSFLITKFYSYNGNIIYIPNYISIYIEISNCFENYFSKFTLLNIFNRENISFRNMPNFDYSQDIIEIFNRTLDINSNKNLQEFVLEHIGLERYSYYQIDIFIKFYIFQFAKFQKKIKFLKDGIIDITKETIDNTVKSTQYFTNGVFSKLLTDFKINKEDYIYQLSDIDDNDLKYYKFYVPLTFFYFNKLIFKTLYISKDTNQYKSEKDFLKSMKDVLYLPNDVENDIDNKKSLISILKEKNNNYIIIYDNFVKLVLTIYRIKANIPTIIMGDTGIGKTFLITKLNQLLNNGETTIEIINFHPGITDERLYEIIKKIDEKARNKKDEELWILFDKINTSFSFLLIKEIFMNRTYYGNKMSDNIRLIGTCNPYRKIKKGREKYGYILYDDNNDNNELVYLVQPLPQSLLYYVFSFGYLHEDNDFNYIKKMLENCFKNEEKELYEKTTEAISYCHRFLRQIFDPSIVSLRDINRFIRCFEFFKDYFKNKNKYKNRNNNEKNNKLRGIICSIYLCYYYRLTDQKIRSNFNNSLENILLELINEKKLDYKPGSFFDKIENKEFKDEIISNEEGKLYQFIDFVKIEQYYLINEIEIDKGIAKNNSLKENIFLLFVSLLTNIPALLIGKPGSSKNLSVELILKSMKGKNSKSKFLQMFPSIIPIYIQGSLTTGPKDIENLFKFATEKLEYSKKEKQENIFTIIFNRMELSKINLNNPLIILDNKLEYLCREKGIRFVGITNQLLNNEILNKVLVLFTQNLEEFFDDLRYTSQCIIEKISTKRMKNEIFKIIVWTYFKYKETLQKMKELITFNQYLKNNKFDNGNKNEGIIFENIILKNDFINLLKKEYKIRKNFHGNYDFFYLIKGMANDITKALDNDDEKKASIIIKQIERNFGGINYDFNLDLNLISKHIDYYYYLENIRYFFKNIKLNNEKRKKQLNSVFIFKCLYNLECENKELINLRIDLDKINDYNIIDCINDNIRDINSRDLLIGIKPPLISIFYQIIKLQNPLKEIILHNESPFLDDNRNKEYIFDQILEIHKDGKDDKLIIIDNFKKINPSLFNIYDRKYEIIDNEKYAKIGFENFNERLIKVNNNLKIILLVDESYMERYDSSFLGRFEKVIFSYENLLDDELKFISNFIIEEFEFRDNIMQEKNYNIMNVLCDEIRGLVYYYCKIIKKNLNEPDNIDKEQLKEKIVDKIYKKLPKDIIDNLSENNILKRKYYENKKIYNFKDYIGSEEYKKSKISLIYTFSSISDTIVGLNKSKSFNFSEIKSENDLNNIFDELKTVNQYNNNENYFCIYFNTFDSTDLQFIINFILNNYKEDIYNYILILHIDNLNNNNIYSFLDINSDISQSFIDDLNSKKLENFSNKIKE